MAQMILYLCRDTNIKVMNILNEFSKKEDVTEFITTIQMVQITINGLLKNKKDFKFELLKDLQNSLKDYETELVQLSGTGKLLRMLTSSRLRRKIEQSNSAVHAKLERFRESIKKDENEMHTPTNEISVNKENGPTLTEDVAIEEEAENNVRLALMIEDQDGKDLWAQLFGLETFMIEWEKFVTGLRKILTDIKEDEEIVLQYILDNSNTGFINQHKFSEFLKGFGQVQDCVKNVKKIASAKWFYGFLSRQETEGLLRDQPAGTFLIRLSSSQPGSFALAFSYQQPTGEKATSHILINSCGPNYQVQEAESGTARIFTSLHEIVDYYSVFLQTPYQSNLPFEPWFEGDFSSSETQECLTGCQPGTFLVRFSSQVGSYAVSFINAEGNISHSLIEHEGISGGGYKIVNDGQPLVFNSLKEVVNYYGDALQYPYKTLSNQLHVEAMKHIVRWKAEREKQMEAVDHIVNDLFDKNKPDHLDPTKPIPYDLHVDSIISRLFSLD